MHSTTWCKEKRNIYARYNSDGNFYIWKSSLINTIAREDLLPVSALPTFPRIILHYSEQEHVVINFDSSVSGIKERSFDMSLIEFEEYLRQYYRKQYIVSNSNIKTHID